jgi:hypothetical protein
LGLLKPLGKVSFNFHLNMLPKVERSGISFYCLNKGGDIKKKAKACLGLSIGLFVS